MSALICAIQPRNQQSSRFVRRPSVERHERAPDSGDPHDVSPPAVGLNYREFDEIGASPDGFFEAMNDVSHQSRGCILFGWGQPFSPVTRRDSSEVTDEGEATTSPQHFWECGATAKSCVFWRDVLEVGIQMLRRDGRQLAVGLRETGQKSLDLPSANAARARRRQSIRGPPSRAPESPDRPIELPQTVVVRRESVVLVVAPEFSVEPRGLILDRVVPMLMAPLRHRLLTASKTFAHGPNVNREPSTSAP
jgi:hypothetical protein